MAYRDELETRRAHVRRLEIELEELEREEELLRALSAGKDGVVERVLGGPRVYERSFRVDGEIEDLGAAAREIFGVDGCVDTFDGTDVWHGEPTPRPRRVEVRAEPLRDGTTLVNVRDTVEYRTPGLLAFLAFALIGGTLMLTTVSPLFALLLVAVAARAAARARTGAVKVTRLRARQAIALQAELANGAPAVRARVLPTMEGPAELTETTEREAAAPAMAEAT